MDGTTFKSYSAAFINGHTDSKVHVLQELTAQKLLPEWSSSGVYSHAQRLEPPCTTE